MNSDDTTHRLIAEALRPTVVQEVLLYGRIGRAVVLVSEDQLSVAIGPRGKNVRSASKRTGWDIEVMTAGELHDQTERATQGFLGLREVSDQLASRLVEEGYFSFDELAAIEPQALKDLGHLSDQQVESIIEQAETAAENENLR